MNASVAETLGHQAVKAGFKYVPKVQKKQSLKL